MDLSLTDEQEALVASFTDLLAKHSSTEAVRAAEPTGHDPELWAKLLEVGAIEMAVPEAAGGWGAAFLDMELVAEQIGASLASAPAIEAQCAARLLASIPTERAAETLRAVLADGQLVTIAVRASAGGTATLVPAGAAADSAIVMVDDRLLLVPLTSGNRHVIANLASAPLADIDIAGAIELHRGPDAVACFERCVDEWLTLVAAAIVGMADVAHAMACQYANERRTWGKLIGSYQAIAHPLADGRTNIDAARLGARKAAWALDRHDQRAREYAAMAFAFASETARDVTYQALHFHGGYGFVMEHDVQLYYRRARGWPRVWGDATAAYRRVATARYGSQER
jgi:alkylation response protein AidB-like acyl-CoA dehydrogenase